MSEEQGMFSEVGGLLGADAVGQVNQARPRPALEVDGVILHHGDDGYDTALSSAGAHWDAKARGLVG